MQQSLCSCFVSEDFYVHLFRVNIADETNPQAGLSQCCKCLNLHILTPWESTKSHSDSETGECQIKGCACVCVCVRRKN